MQEINLLQNKLKDTTNDWEKHNRVIVVLLALVVIAELVIGGMFYILTKGAEDSKIKLDQENTNIKTSLAQMESQLKVAKGFQAQSKNISTLMQTHIVWTDLLNGLSASSYKKGRYLTMNAETSGSVSIEGIAPSYIDLGKMILGLQGYDEVESVKLLQTTPSTSELAGVIFALQVNIKPQIFVTKN